MHWSYKLRRPSDGYARSLLEILRLIFLSRSCRIALAYMEMGLHTSVKMKMHFLHSHQRFLENLDAMTDYQGE